MTSSKCILYGVVWEREYILLLPKILTSNQLLKFFDLSQSGIFTGDTHGELNFDFENRYDSPS